jgi:hypothetical protein
MTSPSKTAVLYRVAYRRTDRPANKGYTYKIFKTEQAAQGFADAMRDPSPEWVSRFPKLKPLAELHVHVAFVRWESLGFSDPNLIAEGADTRSLMEREIEEMMEELDIDRLEATYRWTQKQEVLNS